MRKKVINIQKLNSHYCK